MDFYPSGGSVQPGCVFGIDARPMGEIAVKPELSQLSFYILGLCSHRRAVYYYLHSNWEPVLFPSRTCASVEDCNMETRDYSEVVAYMGETEYYQGWVQGCGGKVVITITSFL